MKKKKMELVVAKGTLKDLNIPFLSIVMRIRV